MSQFHKEEFNRVRREYGQVVTLLTSFANKPPQTRAGQKGAGSKLPVYDTYLLQTAIATANSAYALLLIAKAEAFMRAYLDALSISLGPEPKLSMLIDKCRKEFNNTKPKIPISADSANNVHDLREQRNTYAHVYASSVFPPVARIVVILGRFFDQLP